MYKNLILISILLGCSTTFAADWKPVEGRIMTQWAEAVNPQNPLPEYPRPAMVRENWQSLNGLWDYTIVHKDAVTVDFWDGKILVPFAVESALSGVGKTVGAEKALWYRREFSVPVDWQNQRVLLHFGAVDWQCTVWVNDKEIGSHKGGYEPFTLDITDALKADAAQQIMIRVWDPTNHNNSPIPRGKQVENPEGIWYTSVTGIWQTVWLEPVPQVSISNLKITPDIDQNNVTITVTTSGDRGNLSLVAMTKTPDLSASAATTDNTLVLNILDPKLWSPESPDGPAQRRQQGHRRGQKLFRDAKNRTQKR